MNAVLKALNEARAICFANPEDHTDTSTRAGAVKGERDRADVADALNLLWAAHTAEIRRVAEEAYAQGRDDEAAKRSTEGPSAQGTLLP